MLQSIAEEMHFSWRGKNNKSMHDRPPSLINDSKTSYEISLPTTPVSCSASADGVLFPPDTPKQSSIFAAMFHKRPSHKTAKHPSSLDPKSFSPKSSRSTPIMSIHPPTLSWRQGNKKKNRHSTDLAEEPSLLLPPELPLPDIAPLKDDYFDFRSVGAANLLLDPDDPILTSSKDASPSPTKANSHREDITTPSLLHKSSNSQLQRSLGNAIFSVTNGCKPDDDILPLSSTASSHPLDRAADDAMENLAKVLAESTAIDHKNERPRQGLEAGSEPATFPRPLPMPGSLSTTIRPPPRTHSISALDRLGMAKPSDTSVPSKLTSVPESQSPPSPARTSNSNKSLGGFWKSQTSRRAAAASAASNSSTGLPTLQISTSTLRLRRGSQTLSPESPPRHHSRTASISSDASTAPRRGSIFSASVPSLVQGALIARDKSTQGYFGNSSDGNKPIEPSSFLAPIPTKITEGISLMKRIELSMLEGGYVTDRLHAPKELWYQTNIRLPAMDTKITACELLLSALNRMQARKNFQNASEANKELKALEQTLEQIKFTFAKKFGLCDDPADKTTTLSSQSSNKTSQTIASWSNRFSKSVERMKLDTSKSSEDQYNVYIQTLLRLFAAAQVLDDWRLHYIDMLKRIPPDKAMSYDRILVKTLTCKDTMHKIVCGFVMRDFARLLNKWIKRSREWIDD
ncbi:uncharacterized protein BYT42DRAFT_133988 [Radiomyces spectabilis]|uniref:uncharacterized protein n=1 Tax=Radiomyces spectabilis TaxID=64574 RepID=UPI00221EF1E4|nr:uncharacterized protein BYT42DRAFT_133988 [Radiomyces spectabilis]KAI8367643.1 hypothetical protein BYT42DRAFT_133988 [Radiomyces spectabilis]